MGRILLVVFMSGFARFAFASSCCGQSPSSIPVLFSHQKYSVTPAVSYTQALGRVYDGASDFYVWPSDKQKTVQALSLSGVMSLTQSAQVFLSSSYQSVEMVEQGTRGTSSHVSDSLLGLTYELVSEYTYSPWKPEVFLSAFMNLPTGRSIYDGDSLSEGAQVTGHAQWGAGMGFSLRKVWFPFTVLAQVKVLRLLPETFSGTRVSGFYDTSSSLFATYALPWWGVNVTSGVVWSGLSSRRVSFMSQASASSEVTSVSVALQKNINDDWGVSFAMSDQSLLGRPQNTLLNRAYTLSFNYNYF